MTRSGTPVQSTPARQRQLGDERSRYGRKTLAEQLGELADTIVRYRFWVIAAIVLVGLGAWLAVMSRNVGADRIAVGDCLYIPTSAASDPTATRPIGVERDVEQALFSGAAQEASCSASHGHEVSMITRLGNDPIPPATAYDPATARSGLQSSCTQAFQSFVGHSVEGSAYVTFAVVPTSDQFAAGQRIAMCLVARSDGQWMTSPAHGSGG